MYSDCRPVSVRQGTSRSTFMHQAEYARPSFIMPVQHGLVSSRLG